MFTKDIITSILKTKKLLFVISLVEQSLAFEWFFRELVQTKTEFEVAFLHPQQPALARYCESLNIPVHFIRYKNKSGIPAALIKLWWLMVSRRIHIVHAHLFDASLIALAAAWVARIRQRIHTRHHASQHHMYNPHAIKYDRFINQLSTHIVAISENIKNILVVKEHVPPAKITVVQHGFDLKYFENVGAERVLALSKKYAMEGSNSVIGVVSRFTHWKGIQYIIPAFAALLEQFPTAVLLLANAKGDYEKEIEMLLNSLPKESYRKIIFEPDTPALYHLMNVFVHVPVDEHSEAFGQVYVEALAAGIPSVFTLSGIASEFVHDRKQALIVPYHQSGAITHAIIEILSNLQLNQDLVMSGKKEVAKFFDIQQMVDKMKKIYEQ